MDLGLLGLFGLFGLLGYEVIGAIRVIGVNKVIRDV